MHAAVRMVVEISVDGGVGRFLSRRGDVAKLLGPHGELLRLPADLRNLFLRKRRMVSFQIVGAPHGKQTVGQPADPGGLLIKLRLISLLYPLRGPGRQLVPSEVVRHAFFCGSGRLQHLRRIAFHETLRALCDSLLVLLRQLRPILLRVGAEQMKLRKQRHHVTLQHVLQRPSVVRGLLLPHTAPEILVIGLLPLLLQHSRIEQGFLQIYRFPAQISHGRAVLLVPGSFRRLCAVCLPEQASGIRAASILCAAAAAKACESSQQQRPGKDCAQN